MKVFYMAGSTIPSDLAASFLKIGVTPQNVYVMTENGSHQCALPGDILAIDTGAGERVGTPDYDRHASLSVAAAEWLVRQKVKLLAVDMPTPDVALDKRPAGFVWPVHRVLLAAGVLIAEQVANLAALAGRRAEFMFCPLNIADCDGAPARVLARAIAD